MHNVEEGESRSDIQIGTLTKYQNAQNVIISICRDHDNFYIRWM